MIIVLIGASGTGKSTIEKEISQHYGFAKVISYTTRKPRENEVNGKDYYFISNDEFDDMVKLGLFAEYDEYSQGRKYGTLISDYADGDIVAVLTPNGLRQLRHNMPRYEVYSILIKSSLGTRIKRYIDRIGVEKFNYDDKNEVFSRVERDYGMFLGVEMECNKVIQNEEGTKIKDIVSEIIYDRK